MQRSAGPLAPIGNSGIGRAPLRAAAVSRRIPFLAIPMAPSPAAVPTSTTHGTTTTIKENTK